MDDKDQQASGVIADGPARAPTSSLAPPLLLLAMPQVLDPFFHKSVVLLVHHEQSGGLGFIINRPTTASVTEVLGGLDLSWQGDAEELAYFGGPVEPLLGTVLFAVGEGGLPANEAEGQPTASEVLPGIAMTQHIGDLAGLAQEPPAALRLILGYAGWGDGQLEQEIIRNDWLTAPASRELLFAGNPDTIWTRAFASIGIDPDSLPTWTQRTDDPSEAN
jgi:putative transcriptional regulator